MNCKNCNTQLQSSYEYCHNCGAKVITDRITLKRIANEISTQVFNYDNKVFKTFGHLFTKPEVVIGGYINGVRKKYINVIQYFLISLTVTGLHFFILNTFFENPFNFNPEDFGVGSPDVKNPETVTKYLESTSNIMSNYYSIIYVFTIPISAVTTWVSFRIHSKKFNFTEHLIINTYYSAQVLFISAVAGVIIISAGVNYMTFSLILMLFSFMYLGYVFKRLYNLNLLNSIAYFLIFSFFYILTFAAVMILISMVGFIFALALK